MAHRVESMRCVLSLEGKDDKSHDDEWVLLLLTHHRHFPPLKQITALSLTVSHRAWRRKILPLYKTCLMESQTALPANPALVDCFWQIGFPEHTDQYHTYLPTPFKPWLGNGKWKNESNLHLEMANPSISLSQQLPKLVTPTWVHLVIIGYFQHLSFSTFLQSHHKNKHSSFLSFFWPFSLKVYKLIKKESLFSMKNITKSKSWHSQT